MNQTANGFVVRPLGFLAVMIHAGLDRAVHTRDDLLKYTGVATLGVIPEINVVPTNITAVTATLGTRLRKMIPRAPVTEPIVVSAEVKEPSEGSKLPARLIAGNNPRSPISEAYRTLRTNITFALADTPPKSLVFSSALPGEGKSVTSTNLAITLAQQGMRVLLVDADMRRGTLNALMNVPREPGLSNVLLNMSKIESAVHQIKLDNAISMSLLTTGTVPPNPAELLGSERMRALLAELEASYDIVIFDSPPLNLVTDAAILGSLADGVIVVVRAGETTGDNLTFAVELLRNVHARIIGTVLNAVDFKRDSRYYGAYGGAYGYHYNYEYGPEKG